MKPQIYNIRNTELYLEGFKVPFVSISVGESVGAFPTAQIELAASVNASRILPGTIVQVFVEIDGSKIGEPFLFFEGKITGINYLKNPTQETVSIKCYSLLGNFISTTLRPIDSIMTSGAKINSGNSGGTVDKFKVKVNTTSLGQSGSKETPAENVDYVDAILVGPQSPQTLKKLINTAASKYAEQIAKGSQNSIGIQITHLAGLNDEFINLSNKKFPFNQGDYSQMFYYFGRAFERNDVYFGLESIAFKLIPSMLNLPNPRNQNAFRVRAAQSALQSLSQYAGALGGASGLKNLMEAFSEILNKIEYTMIAPSIFPATKAILTDKESAIIPSRFIFLPDGEMGPPSLCNTIFPDEIVSISYSRDMAAEPTRVISQVQYSMLSDIPDWAWPNFVVPDTAVRKVNGKVQTGMTFEECYRGINLKFTNLDGTFGQLLSEKARKSGNESIKNIKDPLLKANADRAKDKFLGPIGSTDLNNTTNMLYSHGYKQFNQLRANTRGATVTTQWSPYRFIGMPVLAFDKTGPSIIGTLQSLNTSINANGVAQSQLSIAGARLLYEDTVTDDSEYADLLIPEILIDPVSAYNTGIFNKHLYGFSVIGEFVYNIIQYSAVPKNSKAKEELSSKSDNGVTMWDKYKELEEDEITDGSILKFIKTVKDGKLDIDPSLLHDSLGYYTDSRMPYEYKLNLMLQSAIKNLKTLYFNLINNGGENNYLDPSIREFIEAVTFRKVITKSQYLDFLELDLTKDIKYNSKNLHSIMYDTSKLDPINNVSQLKEKMAEVVKTKPENSFDKIELPSLGGIAVLPGLSKSDVNSLKLEIYKLQIELSEYDKTHLKQSEISGFIIDNFQILYERLCRTYSLDSLIPKAEFELYIKNVMNKPIDSFISTNEQSSRTKFLNEIGDTSLGVATKSEYTFNLLISLSQGIILKQERLQALRDQLGEDELLKEKAIKISTDGSPDSINALYKPFNIVRYAHVVKAFQYTRNKAVIPSQDSTDEIIIRGN